MKKKNNNIKMIILTDDTLNCNLRVQNPNLGILIAEKIIFYSAPQSYDEHEFLKT